MYVINIYLLLEIRLNFVIRILFIDRKKIIYFVIIINGVATREISITVNITINLCVRFICIFVLYDLMLIHWKDIQKIWINICLNSIIYYSK